MKMPLISVIVPVYNVEKYLERCVNSIVNQTYKNLEIILVDDGSPDNCGKICDELAIKDNRIKVIHKENGGLSSARNAGLDIATGEYITFVDSDDYISIEIFDKCFELSNVQDFDILIFGMSILDNNSKLLFKDEYENITYSFFQTIYDITLPLKTSVCNKLFKKSIVANIRFPVNIIHGEDLIFWLKILNQKLVIISIDFIGYYYVKNDNSITTSIFSKKSFDEVYCKDIAYSILKEKFPGYSEKAISWCAKSRINLIRKITIYGDLNYYDKVKEFKNWLVENRNAYFKFLPTKFKIEYFLLKNPKVYLIAIKIYKRFKK